MSTVDSSVSITSTTGLDGNTYTTSISNDELTNDDFITLMLTELSLQDPTNPVDSSSMMDSQLQMSTIEANLATVEAMENLTTMFAQSTLSDSANMIGKIVENGNLNDDGDLKQYEISSVSSEDGTIYATAYEIEGYNDLYYFEPVDDADVQIADGNDEGDELYITTNNDSTYSFSTVGKTYTQLAEEISSTDGLSASISTLSDGTSQLVVSVGNGGSSVTQSGVESIAYSKTQQVDYSDEPQTLLYSSISKIY